MTIPLNPRTQAELRSAFWHAQKQDDALAAIAVTTDDASLGADGTLIQSDGTGHGVESSGILAADVVTAAANFGALNQIIVSSGTAKAAQSTAILSTDLVTAAAAFVATGKLIESGTTGKGVAVTAINTADVVVDADIANMVTAASVFAAADRIVLAGGNDRTSKTSEASISATGSFFRLVMSTTHTHPTLIGSAAGDSAAAIGVDCVGLGPDALSGASGSFGTGVVALGSDAFLNSTVGNQCTGVGRDVGEGSTIGADSVLMGQAGATATIGSNCFLAGSLAGFTATLGNFTVAVGQNAFRGATCGTSCFAFGRDAGRLLNSASANDNLFFGNQSGNTAGQGTGVIDTIVFGSNSFSTADHQVILGSASITQSVLRGTVDVVRGTNACRLNVYNTSAAAIPGTSFELVGMRWDTNVAKIGTVKGAAGGTARDLVLETDATERVRVGATTGRVTVKQFLNLDAATELTIATGVITITKSYHRIDTQADAATDDLDTISGGVEGDVLVLRAENGARDVVVKDGTGNIQCAGDMTLDNVQDTITLLFDGTNWLELCRSDNGA